MALIPIRLNGKSRVIDTDPSTPLLYVLRNECDLNGPKFGCGLSQCGSCTVIVDGKAVRSCGIPVSGVRNRNIMTLEGFGTNARFHVIQKAFIEEQAAQCGYCTNGMIMTAAMLLDNNPHPAEPEIKRALNGNLCRCGSHNRIVRAILAAAKVMRGEST